MTFRPLLLIGLCAGCASGSDKDATTSTNDNTDAPPVWCEGTTAHRWDITSTEDADLFPDGLLQKPDSSSPTGVRVEITEATASWLPSTPALLMDAILSMNQMSGFGTLGGVLFRVDGGSIGSVPTSADESMTNAGWILVDLGGATPERVPFEARLLEDGKTIVFWPLRPLRLGTPHAFVVTTEATAADGGCISPTETTRGLLWGDALPAHPNAEEAASRYRAAVDSLGLRPDDISAISVFTTHNEADAWRAVADEAKGESAEWTGFTGCTDRGTVLECEVSTTVLDRRNEDGLVDPSVTPAEGVIPVTVWIPDEGEGPWPVVIYGHGLGSRRSEGYIAARLMGAKGVAVVAMEAVAHGDHPSADPSGGDYEAALGFLGLDLTSLTINPGMMRGNFDQTNLDRVRLLKLIQDHPDFDGDGVPELDGSQVGYLGVSLGAILGPQLLSVSPDIAGAVLSVGGARLMSIVTDTSSLTDFEDIIVLMVGSKERFDRLVPMAQHVVDPVDSGLWGAHVIHDRFDGSPAPSVLLQVGMDDEVVPKTAGFALARAMGLDHLKPVAEDVALINQVEGPLQGNGDGGASTHAFFQFDRVTRGGDVGPAYHIDTPTSEEGMYQMEVFLTGWLEDLMPVAVDPYAALDTPPAGG